MIIFIGPFVAGFANKYGHRSVLMVSSILASLIFCASIFSPNVYVMIIVYGIFGGLLI